MIFFIKVLVGVLSFSLAVEDAVYKPQVDPRALNCSHDEVEIAQELLDLELAGRRFAKAKSSCITGMKLKNILIFKDPNEFSKELVAVKFAKVSRVKYNNKNYLHEVEFEVIGAKGKKLNDRFSFMLLGKLGKPKPKMGSCALYADLPKAAYVKLSCLK